MTYYAFDGETTTSAGGAVLHRIRALVDIPHAGVIAGDVGGYIEGTENLSGGAWVSGDARVYGDARVFGGAQVSDRARVYGGAQVSGDAQVYGGARVSGGARVEILQDILTIGPIGSEFVTATLHRTATGHALHIGCWTGTIDTLAAEVDRRAQRWGADDDTKSRWRAEYAAAATLFAARITAWAGAA